MTAKITPRAKSAAVKNPQAVVKKVAPLSRAGKTQSVQAAEKIKQKKVKMVRDSFSMPETDYDSLIALKKKCLAAGVQVKKSELLRVGLMSLVKLSNASLIASVKKVAGAKKSSSAKN